MYGHIPEAMKRVIEPVVEGHDLELVDVERRTGPTPWLLRVIVDNAQGDGRVPVERCAEVARELGVHLDAEDLVPVRFDLEVSSPGLSRVLGRERDFHAACGRRVKIETREAIDGRRRFTGVLLALAVGRVCMEQDDAEKVEIPFDAIVRAKALYEFSKADFASPQRRKNKTRSTS